MQASNVGESFKKCYVFTPQYQEPLIQQLSNAKGWLASKLLPDLVPSTSSVWVWRSGIPTFNVLEYPSIHFHSICTPTCTCKVLHFFTQDVHGNLHEVKNWSFLNKTTYLLSVGSYKRCHLACYKLWYRPCLLLSPRMVPQLYNRSANHLPRNKRWWKQLTS